MAKYCVLHKKFAAVLNLTQNPKQKITHIASIFTQLCAFVRQLKIFQWTQKSGIFYGTLINCSTLRKSIIEFWLIPIL